MILSKNLALLAEQFFHSEKWNCLLLVTTLNFKQTQHFNTKLIYTQKNNAQFRSAILIFVQHCVASEKDGIGQMICIPSI